MQAFSLQSGSSGPGELHGLGCWHSRAITSEEWQDNFQDLFIPVRWTTQAKLFQISSSMLELQGYIPFTILCFQNLFLNTFNCFIFMGGLWGKTDLVSTEISPLTSCVWCLANALAFLSLHFLIYSKIGIKNFGNIYYLWKIDNLDTLHKAQCLAHQVLSGFPKGQEKAYPGWALDKITRWKVFVHKASYSSEHWFCANKQHRNEVGGLARHSGWHRSQ